MIFYFNRIKLMSCRLRNHETHVRTHLYIELAIILLNMTHFDRFLLIFTWFFYLIFLLDFIFSNWFGQILNEFQFKSPSITLICECKTFFHAALFLYYAKKGLRMKASFIFYFKSSFQTDQIQFQIRTCEEQIVP